MPAGAPLSIVEASLQEELDPLPTGNENGLRRSVLHRERTIRVLEADPDLCQGLDEVAAGEARRAAVAEVLQVKAGPCDRNWALSRPAFGFLIVSGLMTRRVEIAGASCCELIGPGDVLRPWLDCGAQGALLADADWHALVTSSIAALDHSFAETVRPWPEIPAALMDRLLLRSRWLEFQLAVRGGRRVEERLLLTLWQFAYRWGTVLPGGVALRLPLTHRLLAEVVGAERPTVSTALGQLKRDGLIDRTRARKGGLLLLGDPPAEVERVGGPL